MKAKSLSLHLKMIERENAYYQRKPCFLKDYLEKKWGLANQSHQLHFWENCFQKFEAYFCQTLLWLRRKSFFMVIKLLVPEWPRLLIILHCQLLIWDILDHQFNWLYYLNSFKINKFIMQWINGMAYNAFTL